jgi:DNA-binding HxlR family transcriptional regulator
MQSPTATTTLPTELGSARSKLVYLYLSTHGPTRLEGLERDLEMRKLTLYGVLRHLRERGLVRRDGDRYVPT